MATAVETQTGAGAGSALAKEQCIICLQQVPTSKMQSPAGCRHRYCRPCLRNNTVVQAQQWRLPNRCPVWGCPGALSMQHWRQMTLEGTILARLEQMEVEAAIPEANKVWCPNQSCSTLLILEGAERGGPAKCPVCTQAICTKCRLPAHGRLSCSGYRTRHGMREERQLVDLADRSHWRQCPNCRQMIERTAGCSMMTCKCSQQFCYRCGVSWGERGHVCLAPCFMSTVTARMAAVLRRCFRTKCPPCT